MTERPDLEDMEMADVLELAIDARLSSTRTVIPAEVVEYDHPEQRATVQPVIRFSRRDAEDWSRQTYRPEPVPNCPVLFPQGGGFSITFPLEPGDPVKLSVADRSLDEWLTGGGTDVEPSDPRRFDLQDAVVEPGLRSFANALAEDRIDEGALVVGGEEIHLGSSNPDRWVALAELVEERLQKIENYVKNNVREHDHQYAVPLIPIAPGSTSNVPVEPVPSTQDQDTASDKVKSE